MRSRSLIQLVLLSLMVSLSACSANAGSGSTMSSDDGRDAGRDPGTSGEGTSDDQEEEQQEEEQQQEEEEEEQDTEPEEEWPAEITAHLDETCNQEVFAGFQVTIGESEGTCTSRFAPGEDTIQITVGEMKSAPPTSGRTYDVIPTSDNTGLYPADGDANAVETGSMTRLFAAGSLTMMPDGDGYVGSYMLEDEDGMMVTGTFRADHCTPSPGDCE